MQIRIVPNLDVVCAAHAGFSVVGFFLGLFGLAVIHASIATNFEIKGDFISFLFFIFSPPSIGKDIGVHKNNSESPSRVDSSSPI